MNSNSLSWTTKITKIILFIIGVSYFVVYLLIVFNRITYPFELEWIEGSMVDHVIRILSGQKLYVAPSLQFVPFLYTPLYYYLAAVASKILGVGFIPLRLVSFMSSLGCLFIIFLITKKETASVYWGIIASSLFAATYRIGGAWFDIARVDSLYLFLLLVALYIVKFHDSAKSYIFAGILISLSFLTKQTAMYVLLPLMVYGALFKGWRSLFFIVPAVLITGISTLLLNYIHDGWYNYYIFEVPLFAPFIKENIIKFWTRDMLSHMPVAFSLSTFYVVVQIVKGRKNNYCFYILTVIGLFGGAWLSRIRPGGYDNVLIPSYAIISILWGLGLNAVFKLIQSLSEYRQKLMQIFLYLVCLFQFASLIYNPFNQIPSKMDLEAGTAFINFLSTFKGDILVPDHNYLPTLTGKKSCAHEAAVWDVLSSGKAMLTDEIPKAIQEKRFSAIILDRMRPPFWSPELKLYYTIHVMKYKSPTEFIPVTGDPTRPSFFCLPKKNNTN